MIFSLLHHPCGLGVRVQYVSEPDIFSDFGPFASQEAAEAWVVGYWEEIEHRWPGEEIEWDEANVQDQGED